MTFWHSAAVDVKIESWGSGWTDLDANSNSIVFYFVQFNAFSTAIKWEYYQYPW
jgi:hypothetical protein